MKTTLLLSLAASLLFQTAARAESLVPKLMNYQGYLTDSGGTPLGEVSSEIRGVTFRFWNHATDAAKDGEDPNLLYAESHDVTILEGNFSVLLGSGSDVSGEAGAASTNFNTLFDRAELFLGITVDDEDVGTTDAEITPRQQLVSTAFAFRAAVAERVDAQAITADQISPGTITANEIDTDAVESDEIATSAVGSDEIATSAVGSDEIATNAVGSDEIADGSILGADIFPDTITAAEIDTDAVDSDEIAANSVGTSELQDGAVTADQLGTNTVQVHAASSTNVELRIARGTVRFNSDTQGDFEHNGSGYNSIEETSKGVFKIDYYNFANDGTLPTLVVTQLESQGGDSGKDDNTIIISDLRYNWAEIQIWDANISGDDTNWRTESDGFCFIVIGTN